MFKLKHVIFVPSRCSKCLTKLWCSRECLSKDWEMAHKVTCNEQPDKRKVKADKKERTEAGGTLQRRIFKKESLHLAEKAAASGRLGQGRRNQVLVEEVAAACHEEGNQKMNKKLKDKKSKQSVVKGANESEVD